MINAAAKGRACEKEVQAILEAEGYVVERARPIYAWVTGRPMALRHDYFGLFDLIAVHSSRKVLFVQVKQWEGVSVAVKKITGTIFTKGAAIGCQIWGRIDGRGAHYRVLDCLDKFEWKGVSKMVIKEKKCSSPKS